MGKLVLFVLALALVWSGWWFVGSSALDRGLTRGLEDLRQAGWRIEVADRRIRGFPSRFDTTFDAPDVTSPSGTRITAPFFQILALSYKPNQVIAAFPPEMTVETAAGAYDVTNQRARGSATFRAATALPLDHSSVVIDALAIDGDRLSVTAEEVRLASRIPDGAPDARHQNIGLSVSNLRLPDSMLSRVGPDADRVVDDMHLDITLELTEPLDRHALETPPEIDGIEVHDLRIDWGDIRLEGDGMLEVGADGYPIGTIALELTNWQAAIAIASTLGLLPAGQSDMIVRGLMMMTGGSDTVNVPVSFAEGQILLGPVPVGAAPRLR